MPKKLIIFCDGTWNKPTEYSTNVLRMLQATQPKDYDKNPQIVHYIPGIGTRKGESLRGGTFGYGISDNIMDAYSFIVSNYECGDEIFLFGFSRGAYTARSIAGLVRNFGILKRTHLALVDVAYDHYKSGSAEWHPDGAETKEFRQNYCHKEETNEDTTIKFLGVWDTVGALGAPFGAVVGFIVDKLFKCSFHDTKLSTYVLNAYHALAIDERRWPFRPTLWQTKAEHEKRNKESMKEHGYLRYEQKWFPGVHSDVGGGYKQTGLSDCALSWMAECAARHGFNADLKRIADRHGRSFAPDPKQPISKSQTPLYQLATFAFVKLPSLLKINSVYPKGDYALVKNITLKGDYIRPH
jgi:uncharacterized protein (DUF2235 family)